MRIFLGANILFPAARSDGAILSEAVEEAADLSMVPKEQKQEPVTLFAEHDVAIGAGTHFVDLPPQLAHARVRVGTSERARKFPEGRGAEIEGGQFVSGDSRQADATRAFGLEVIQLR